MKALATPAQMRALDAAAIQEYGLPGLILMENAAAGVAEFVAAREGAGGAKPPALAVCGKGNNGGDGLAVARKLRQKGHPAEAFVLAARADVAGDARKNLEICERVGIHVGFADGGGGAPAASALAALRRALGRAGCVVDAIFGTGFSGAPRGLHEAAIRLINASGKRVYAVDAPSGLDTATGRAGGACVRARATLALGMLKPGLVTGPGAPLAGEVALLDIGIPPEAARAQRWDTFLAEGPDVAAMLPRRAPDAHKGRCGKVLIVTGSPGMTGAGLLAAEAALRAGAGLVYLAVPAALAGIYEAAFREAVTLGVGAAGDAAFSPAHAPELLSHARNADAVAVGPGIAGDPGAMAAVLAVIEGARAPLVIDAGALAAVARDRGALKRRPRGAGAVLTPHEGEMARLAGIPAEDVAGDRVGCARAFAREWGAAVALKGRGTVVASPDGQAWVNPTGNPGMATAGMGDVLTGVVAALAAQGLPPARAALAGAYLHGMAGDMAAAERGEEGLIAGDVAARAGAALRALRTTNGGTNAQA